MCQQHEVEGINKYVVNSSSYGGKDREGGFRNRHEALCKKEGSLTGLAFFGTSARSRVERSPQLRKIV